MGLKRANNLQLMYWFTGLPMVMSLVLNNNDVDISLILATCICLCTLYNQGRKNTCHLRTYKPHDFFFSIYVYL